jgi:hypothetical protein
MNKKVVLLAFSLFIFPLLTRAQEKPVTVQSVFVYAAIKYMEWPNDDQAQFKILLFGESPLFGELIKMSQLKKAGSRSIEVQMLTSLDDIKPCHIIYVANSKTSAIAKLLTMDAIHNAVIMSEQSGALDKGSDLNFLTENDHLSFQMNTKSLAAKGIRVSGSFAKLAQQ